MWLTVNRKTSHWDALNLSKNEYSTVTWLHSKHQFALLGLFLEGTISNTMSRTFYLDWLSNYLKKYSFHSLRSYFVRNTGIIKYHVITQHKLCLIKCYHCFFKSRDIEDKNNPFWYIQLNWYQWPSFEPLAYNLLLGAPYLDVMINLCGMWCHRFVQRLLVYQNGYLVSGFESSQHSEPF